MLSDTTLAKSSCRGWKAGERKAGGRLCHAFGRFIVVCMGERRELVKEKQQNCSSRIAEQTEQELADEKRLK